MRFGLTPGGFLRNYVLPVLETVMPTRILNSLREAGDAQRIESVHTDPIELTTTDPSEYDPNPPPHLAFGIELGSLNAVDATVWRKQALESVSNVSTIAAKAVDNPNPHMPEALSVRTFTLGGPGSGGPSFQIAENFGATVTQITTADKKDLLWTKAEEGKYSRELTGAGAIGGMPIVAPAGRTLSEGAKMIHEGKLAVKFPQEYLGLQGRIPLDKHGVMSHGAIFTSQAWSQPKVESIGNRGEDGIRVTYSLDCMKDDVLSYMGPGKIDAVYTLVKGKNGETIFDSDIKITTENELQPVYIGALAQHSFFKTTKNDIMQTSAPDEVKAQEDRPELPTGKIGAVTKENDFNKARKVHDGKNREVVLTGYEKTEDKRPKATLHRDGLKIEIEAGGVIGDVHGFDGFLLCNKTNGATDRVMLEPIARYPNIMNVPHKSKNPMKPIIVTKDEPFRAHSRITAMAV